MSSDTRTTISTFSADDVASHVGELGALLHACVHDGASISFVLPFTQAESEAFWSKKVRPYASLGYQTAGIIPGYCRDPIEDRLDSTTIMYKVL